MWLLLPSFKMLELTILCCTYQWVTEKTFKRDSAAKHPNTASLCFQKTRECFSCFKTMLNISLATNLVVQGSSTKGYAHVQFIILQSSSIQAWSCVLFKELRGQLHKISFFKVMEFMLWRFRYFFFLYILFLLDIFTQPNVEFLFTNTLGNTSKVHDKSDCLNRSVAAS